MADMIKPCPFCGGAAHASLAAYASGATAHVLCDGCGAAVLGYGRGERGLRDAVKRWNFRAERTCHMEYAGEVPPQIRYSCYFCSECGSPIYNDMEPSYCLYCGAKVVDDD